MQQSEGVRAAIQCLAATYIYDYVATNDILFQINNLFGIAEARLTVLLNQLNLVPTLDESDCNELVAITSMLSMQDVG